MPGSASPRDTVVGAAGAAAAGLLAGVLGTFKHQVGVSATTGTGIPVGLVLALAMVVALLVALRLSSPTRLLALAAGVGVLVATGVLSLPGPSGGDQVVLLNFAGLAWLGGVVVAVALVVGWPRVGGRPGPDGILEGGPAERPPTTRSA